MRDGCTTESAVEGLEVGSSHEEKLKWHQREPSGRPPSLSRWQALDSASSVAAAYSVGRTEASAATNLLKSVSASTRNQLKELVRRCPTISIIRKHVNLEMSDNIRYQFNIVQYIYIYIYNIFNIYQYINQFVVRIHGQPRFILHDGIAAGIFNVDYSGVAGSLGAWEKHLGNTQETIDLMLRRMRSDFESLAPKMRKPWSQQQLDSFQTS